MNERTKRLVHVPGIVAAALLSACGAVTDSLSFKADAAPEVFEGPVPRADCGPGSNPEMGVQGRTRSVEDVASGRAAEGYTCNLELVGEEGTGALWQLAWYDDCAYYGIGLGLGGGTGGVAVVDASDPANPVRTTTLMTPAMLDPWESLKVNEKRGLLAGASLSVAGPGVFDLYDVNEVPSVQGQSALGYDCAYPRLTSSLPMDATGHEGAWAPDGLTYYGSLVLVSAIDVSLPTAPRFLSNIVTPGANGVANNESSHGFSISNDGNRAYMTGPRCGGNGMKIIDISAIQSRDPVPISQYVGDVCWDDGAAAQHTIPVTINGKPYVIFVDESGLGMTRIIDISDETNPFVISKLKNEINMPEAGEMRTADGGNSGFTYQGHYCGVPQREEPGVVACSYFWQGIRVFDIRDPYHPKEIAYYVHPGTANNSAQIRFVEERGEIWFTDQDHGFVIARFTNGAWPFKD